MDAPSDGIVSAWIGLATVSRRVFERIEGDLKAADLPPLSWYDLLLEAERAGPDGIRPTALQERLLLPQYGTSRLIDRMAEAGLVERHPHPGDGRGQIVKITRRGEEMRRAIWPVYARALAATLGAALSGEEADDLARLLGTLGSRMRSA